jgi:hypothetical protein
MDRGTHSRLLERSTGYRDLVTAYERADEERRAAQIADEDEEVLT